MGRKALALSFMALMFLALTLLTTLAWADDSKGMIRGQVINKTAGGGPVGNLPVTLHIHQGTSLVEKRTTRADAAGAFRFADLSATGSYSYTVSTYYQGVEYSSEPAGFAKDQTTLPVLLEVYEGTNSDAQVSVQRVHILANLVQGALQTSEFYIFQNTGDRTFIGSGEPITDGQRATLRFSLPGGAKNVEYGQGLEGVVFGGDVFTATTPILPGMQPVLFSYRLPMSPPTVSFSRKLDYAVSNLSFLVPDVGQVITSTVLVARERMSGQGTNYLHLAGQNLARGTEVTVDFSNIPAKLPPVASPGPAATTEERSYTSTTDQSALYRVVLVGLGALAVVIALGYALQRRRTQAMPTETARAVEDRASLILAIADLDDRYETGKIDEEEYRVERAGLKRWLAAIMRER